MQWSKERKIVLKHSTWGNILSNCGGKSNETDGTEVQLEHIHLSQKEISHLPKRKMHVSINKTVKYINYVYNYICNLRSKK